MAHSQPVHKELHQGLHFLGMEEVSHYLGDPAASRPGPGSGKDARINTHSGRNRMAGWQLSPVSFSKCAPRHTGTDLTFQHLGS